MSFNNLQEMDLVMVKVKGMDLVMVLVKEMDLVLERD